MSSVGQGVGMVVGGVIGFYAGGNVALGASVGGAIGGYLDPPKGAKGRPPSASELAMQTSSYGVYMGRGYGTYARFGNVFWIEGNTLVAREHESEGGKGGASAPPTYDLYGTFAIGFSEGEIDAFKRIWINGKLVFDAGASSVSGAIASGEAAGTIAIYTGSATQLPDPRIQADLGAENTPAWRGLPYIVFKDWPMADFGNTIMGLQARAEIVVNGAQTAYCAKQADLYGTSSDGTFIAMTRLDTGRLIVSATGYQTWDFDLQSVHRQEFIMGDDKAHELSEISVDAWHDEPFNSKTNIAILQSDSDCMLALLHRNTPTRLIGYTTAGSLFVDTGNVDSTYFSIDDYRAVVDRGEIFLAAIGNRIFRIGTTVDPVPYLIYKSAAAWTIRYFGVSENYLFGVLYSSSSSTSCTVYKIDRATLDLVDTFTQGVGGTSAKIHVVSDSEFYTMPTNGVILRWLDGVASDTGLRYTGPVDSSDRLLVQSPDFAWVHSISSTPTNAIYACWKAVASANVQLADIILAECLQTGLLAAPDIDTSEINQEVRGYDILNPAAIRTGFEPLRAAWPFDAIVHGYKLKFVPRGGISVASIDIGELGAATGKQSAPQITFSREMDSQLPRRVNVSYLDISRDYDTGSGPGAERLNTDAVNAMQVDLGIVLNADEAACVEDMLLRVYWLERSTAEFTLPPTYAHLEPSDVVTIISPAATHELRLTQINVLPDGRLECTAKPNRAAVYSPVAVGQESTSTGQTLSLAGPSVMELLDIPCVDATYMNTPGFVVAMSGYVGTWPGGNVFESADGGDTFAAAQGVPAPGAVIGRATNAIGSGMTHIIDTASRLNVRTYTGSLYSVSESEMFNGANHFAYGADGRWEIIAAKTIAVESDDSFTMGDMLRGRFGSEWAMTTHQANDAVVLLDASALRFIGQGVATINAPKVYRGVTKNKLLSSANNQTMTYHGVNLECLSPIYLNGTRSPATLDWVIGWTPRSRTPVEAFSGIPTPIGETSERYEVDFYDATFTTIKRTVTGLTSPECPYSYADQVSDFGSERGTLYVDVFEISSVVGRGYPLRQSITRSIVIDPYFDSVKSLLHFDGAHGSTSFTDELGNTWAAVGNAALSTTNKLFGTAALGLDGVTDYITSIFAADPLNGTGDFTIEWWERPQDQGNRGRFTVRNTAISGTGSIVGVAVGWDGVYWQAYGGGSSHQMGGAGNANPLNTWTHMALERYAGTVNLFKAGNKLGSGYADTTNYSGNIYVAAGAYYSNAYTLLGDMEEFRITKRARYQGTNFTPPTTPFPNS